MTAIELTAPFSRDRLIRGMHLFRMSRTALFLGLLSWFGAGMLAAQGRIPEYKIKARFLLFVGQAVTRQDGSALVPGGNEFQLGVFGRSPFEDHLRPALEGRTIGGRPVRLVFPRTPAEVRACHMVFISPSEMDRMGEIAGWLEGHPVITVGDRVEFLDQGGMVAFLLSGERVEIWVNQSNTKSAGLTFDPSFLGLVKMHKGGGRD